MKDQIEAWIDTRADWPVLTTSIAKKWLTDGDGLQDRGITRDLDWGIPVQRGDDPWPGMEGKVFYVWFDAPIEYIACAQEWVDAGKGEQLGTLVAHGQGRRGCALHPVHGQGQRALPHPVLPGDDPRIGGAVEARRLHQVLQLPELRWRPVQHVPRARRFHGPGAGNPAGGLLALVAAVQCAGDLRCRVHMGSVPVRREQGPRRRAGQLCQPRDKVLPVEILEAVPQGGARARARRS